MSAPPRFVRPGPAAEPDTGPARWVIASFRRRLLAALADGVVVVGLGFVACMPTWLISERAGPFSEVAGWNAVVTAGSTTGDLLIGALENLIFLAVWLLYTGWLPTRVGPEHGQTLGMKTLKIRLVMLDGSPLGGPASWCRARWLSGISLFAVAGELLDAVAGTAPVASHGLGALSFVVIGLTLVLALRTDLRRTFYDRFAGTVVVDAEPTGVPADGAPVAVAAKARTPATWALTALTLVGVAAAVFDALSPSTFA